MTIAVKPVHNSNLNWATSQFPEGHSIELHCVIRPLLYCSLLVGSQGSPLVTHAAMDVSMLCNYFRLKVSPCAYYYFFGESLVATCLNLSMIVVTPRDLTSWLQ